MAGLRGLSRLARADPRSRRNSQALASNVEFVDPAQSVIQLTDDGYLTLNLASAGGLQAVSQALGIKLDATNPGLSLSSAGIKALVQGVIGADASGIKLNLGEGVENDGSDNLRAKVQGVIGRDASGLKLNIGEGVENDGSDNLQVKLDGATMERSASGLKVADATEAQRGSVLQQGLVADVAALTDNSGGTSGAGTIAAVGIAVTAPADTPADADALRDDLVANTIPSIETELSNLRDAVATLAAYNTTLENKINDMLAAQKTAGQMNTV